MTGSRPAFSLNQMLRPHPDAVDNQLANLRILLSPRRIRSTRRSARSVQRRLAGGGPKCAGESSRGCAPSANKLLFLLRLVGNPRQSARQPKRLSPVVTSPC